MFKSWTRGDKLVLVRNPDYWGATSDNPTEFNGTGAKIDELIFRPIADNAARLQALQTGEINGYDLVEPQDIPTIEENADLQILDRPAFNVGYVGFNISMPPLDDLEGPPGDRLRARPAGRRRLVLRRPRRGGEGVHAARRSSAMPTT